MKHLSKVELHLHVEGAAPPAFIRGLAQEKGRELRGVFDDRGHYAYRDFKDFLRVYEAVSSVLETPADYARLLSAVLSECGEQGAIYVELFISPEFCGGGDLCAWRDYLGAMQEVAQAYALSGVDSLYSIVQMPRGYPVATMAIGGAANAGLMAAAILALTDPALAARLDTWRAALSASIPEDPKDE